MAAAASEQPEAPTTRRADIQGLRALAIGAVVAYHYFPQQVRGGFVGVDVFFVISGFLIIGLLDRELRGTGRVRLAAFYARRITRLLPAALLVLVATTIASAPAFDRFRILGVVKDVAWSSIGLANVHFAGKPRGYFAAGDQSPVIHFWSLAVEEQFYLVWPLVLVAVALVARRFSARMPVRSVLVILAAASFVACLLWTRAGSAHAFYSLASRGWELAVGGILALSYRRIPLNAKGSMVAGALGLVMIGAATVGFSARTVFPGAAALLPVLGSALVIWSGCRHEDGVVQRVLSVRPAQFLGNISYSLYLWHWPVLIIGAALKPNGGLRWDLVLLVLALAASTASYRLVEQPAIRRRARFRPRAVAAAGLAAILLIGSASAVSAQRLRPRGSDLSAPDNPPPDLRLASAVSPIRFVTTGPGVVPDAVPANVTPPIEDLADDLAPVFTNGCFALEAADALTSESCQGGDPQGGKSILLIGDSMAGALWPALDRAGREHGWRLTVLGHNGCPIVDARMVTANTDDPWPACDHWQDAVADVLTRVHPDLIIWTANAAGYQSAHRVLGGFDAKWRPGVERTLTRLRRLSPVLVVGQMPSFTTTPESCLMDHLTSVAACSRPLITAVPPAIARLNADVAKATGTAYLDPTQLLCTDVCPLMSSRFIMYRDTSHISATFAEQLAAQFGAVIDAVLAQPR